MKTNFEVYLLAVTLAGLTTPLTAMAQGDSVVAAACARAEATLRSRVGGGEYNDAIAALQGCPVDGPRLLAEQWTDPPRDSVPLRLLADVSSRILDRRLFEAARTVVVDGGATRDGRLAAMRVLAGHYDPCVTVDFRVNSQPDAAGRAVAAWFGRSNVNPSKRGSEPLPSSVRGDVLTTLDAVAMTGADSMVREAARRLAAHLRAASHQRCG